MNKNTNKKKAPKDINKLAAFIVKEATKEKPSKSSAH